MAESDSELSEAEFLDNLDGLGVQPYMFEPERQPEDVSSASSSDSSDDSSEESDGGDGNGDGRVGNTDWCQCEQCGQMPTKVESFCCQELGELNEKFRDGGRCTCFPLECLN